MQEQSINHQLDRCGGEIPQTSTQRVLEERTRQRDTIMIDLDLLRGRPSCLTGPIQLAPGQSV